MCIIKLSDWLLVGGQELGYPEPLWIQVYPNYASMVNREKVSDSQGVDFYINCLNSLGAFVLALFEVDVAI